LGVSRWSILSGRRVTPPDTRDEPNSARSSSSPNPLLPEHKRIILDLTELTRMGSLGLGTLARLYLSAHSAGCSLELMNLAPA
jgi:hypothetical protein